MNFVENVKAEVLQLLVCQRHVVKVVLCKSLNQAACCPTAKTNVFVVKQRAVKVAALEQVDSSLKGWSCFDGLFDRVRLFS